MANITKTVWVTPDVTPDAGAFLSSFRYSKEGSACLNGPQWYFDQYGRGPVSPASISDDCPGSDAFLANRLVVEQEARPEYYARLNAAGIVGYSNISSVWDSQYGQASQARSYLLGLTDAQSSYQVGSTDVLQNEADAARKLGTPQQVDSGLSF